MKWLARTIRTARTYPVDTRELGRAFEGTVRGFPRWELEISEDGEIRALRRTGFGSDEVRVRLVRLESGVHTNTLAEFECRSTSSLPDPGRPRRNLDRVLKAVDQNLSPGTSQLIAVNSPTVSPRRS